ncbi:class I SAM-dependent RNA methyltransferase [Jiangella ureilytica]|uniref:Class I SAM-dependent RNA methyltransferase n=1 Tax=Jiangella ureilytica TaxID=2530374 RepID=A0A4R4RG30_9ACTN|nr:class I SAM-dependent RNA methyltransferase [Jiangella ureilytica]
MSGRARTVRGESVVGTEVVVEVGPVAHGGVCVARHEGRAVFVRHTLPGERVRIRITEGGTEDRFWRADAVAILTPSPARVEPPCPWAGPGKCGGCDWQHVLLPAQRSLKAAVVSEQLERLAGIRREVTVEPVPGDENGLSWRTRVTYAVDAAGRAGLRQHRSHEVVPVDTCLIAHDAVRAARVEDGHWPGASSVEVVAATTGERQIIVDDEVVEGRGHVVEEAAGRRWRVSGGGFWQVHPGAAATLVGAVLDGVRARPGERAMDLYCGVGLFAGALANAVGPAGSVFGVEGSRQAIADARRNLHDVAWVRLVAGRVDRVLSATGPAGVPDAADVVVLDPPREGAKSAVVRRIAARRPRVVAYVACDPAALARDLATFAGHGYRLAGLRAFDLFPMTHHVECVAILEPDRSG